MDCEEINLKLNGLTSNEDQHQLAVNEMIISMYTMNTDKFESTLDQCFQRWSADVVLKNVILEFLKKTGLQWKGRRQTEEHLAVTTIRNKISASIDKLNVNLSRRKSVLLFLPDSKQLDLVLLYTCFILRSKGYKVLYMGMDVTIPNLKMIFKSKQPDVAITYLPVKTKSFYNELSHWLSDQLPHSRFFIIPYPKDDLAFHSGNISVLSLEKVIEEFSE